MSDLSREKFWLRDVEVDLAPLLAATEGAHTVVAAMRLQCLPPFSSMHVSSVRLDWRGGAAPTMPVDAHVAIAFENTLNFTEEHEEQMVPRKKAKALRGATNEGEYAGNNAPPLAAVENAMSLATLNLASGANDDGYAPLPRVNGRTTDGFPVQAAVLPLNGAAKLSFEFRASAAVTDNARGRLRRALRDADGAASMVAVVSVMGYGLVGPSDTMRQVSGEEADEVEAACERAGNNKRLR
jgi:hypothetical protein